MEYIEVLAVDDTRMKELKMAGNNYLNTVENSRKRIIKEVNSIKRKFDNENLSEFQKKLYLSRLQMLDADLEFLSKSLAKINSALKGE